MALNHLRIHFLVESGITIVDIVIRWISGVFDLLLDQWILFKIIVQVICCDVVE